MNSCGQMPESLLGRSFARIISISGQRITAYVKRYEGFLTK